MIPKTREEALAKLNRLLSRINKLSPMNLKMHYNHCSIARRDWNMYIVRRAWLLVCEWKLQDELSQHKRRDYLLVLDDRHEIAARKPRRVLRLALDNGNWDSLLFWIDSIKFNDLTYVIEGMSVGRHYSKGLASEILEKFPTFGKEEAKMIVVDKHLIKLFYPAIKQFGPKLYRWSKTERNKKGNIITLLKLECPADSFILKTALRYYDKEVVKMLVSLGAVVTQEIQDIAKTQFRTYWFSTNEQVQDLFAKYGVDPKTLYEYYFQRTLEHDVRAWLVMLTNSHRAHTWDSNRSYRSAFSQCLHLIKRFDPELYAQIK